MISKYGVVYSPFELAVLAGESSHLDKPGPRQSNFANMCPQDISKLKTHMINLLINEYCGGHATDPGYYLEYDAGAKNALEQDRAFANYLMAYLYQGIPIIMSVDSDKLYPKDNPTSSEVDTDENELDEREKRNTKEHAAHYILIHGLVRLDQEIPEIIISDSTDMHETGSVFQQISCRKLIDCRTVREEPPDSSAIVTVDDTSLSDDVKDESAKMSNFLISLIVPSPQGLEVSNHEANLRLKLILRGNNPVYGIMNLNLEEHFLNDPTLIDALGTGKKRTASGFFGFTFSFGKKEDENLPDGYDHLRIQKKIEKSQSTLRNISQWSGFMHRRAFRSNPKTKFSGEFQTIVEETRDWIRKQNFPEFMWIGEIADTPFGIAIDTVEERTAAPRIGGGKYDYKGAGGVFIQDKLCLLYAPEKKIGNTIEISYWLTYMDSEEHLQAINGKAIIQ
jgi:hypothetical protein